MTKTPHPPDPTIPPRSGHPLATVGYLSRFWEVYLEFEDPPRRVGEPHRAFLSYAPLDRSDDEPILQTVAILIEPSHEEVLHRARGLNEHQLVALLRSLLP
jgi:hypothetical protein